MMFDSCLRSAQVPIHFTCTCICNVPIQAFSVILKLVHVFSLHVQCNTVSHNFHVYSFINVGRKVLRIFFFSRKAILYYGCGYVCVCVCMCVCVMTIVLLYIIYSWYNINIELPVSLVSIQCFTKELDISQQTTCTCTCTLYIQCM